MRRPRPAVLVLVLVFAWVAPDARGHDVADHDRVACSERSWTGGTTEWCDGTFVYRDHVYDDNGADTRPGSVHGTPLDRATGDVDHRDHGQALNSADLLALRMQVRDGVLHVRFDLNTLFPTDETVAVLAIDVDNSDETGSENLGHFGVRAPGVDRLHVFDQRDADPHAIDAHLGGVITGSIPVPPAPAGEWDLYAFTALGDGTVMNVAFRGDESGSWWEAEQAAALRDGSIGAFKGELTVSDLTSGRHDPASPGEGLLSRVYRSAFAIGDAQEGVDYDGVPGRAFSRTGAFSQTFRYLGHFQPYGVYVPVLSVAPWGVQLALHGRSAGHASLVSNDGMQERFGEDLDRVIVVPLARGPEGGYSDWSERDVLDVLADVEATFPIDRERVFAGGYSMGGYGAFRLAALHPHRFAGVVTWAGHTGDCTNGTPFGDNDPCPNGAVGNMLRYLQNLRHVPTATLWAAGDEHVWATAAEAVRARLAELGYRHVWWQHAAEHLTFAVLDDWAKEAAWTRDLRRVREPARITYRTDPSLGVPALGLVHDRAYWVSRIRTAHGGEGVVDLTSHRCEPDPPTALTNGAGVDPLPWVSQEAVWTDHARTQPSGDHISGTLTNIAELTLDTASPCFAADLSRLETTVPAVVRFTDGRQPVTLTP